MNIVTAWTFDRSAAVSQNPPSCTQATIHPPRRPPTLHKVSHKSAVGAALPAGVGVEPLALQQARVAALPALALAGVGVEWLAPRTHGRTHAAAQLPVPALASGAGPSLRPGLALAFTLDTDTHICSDLLFQPNNHTMSM